MPACEKQISDRCSKNHWSYFIIIIIYSAVFVHCNFDRCRSAVYCYDQVFYKYLSQLSVLNVFNAYTEQRLEQKCNSEKEVYQEEQGEIGLR